MGGLVLKISEAMIMFGFLIGLKVILDELINENWQQIIRVFHPIGFSWKFRYDFIKTVLGWSCGGSSASSFFECSCKFGIVWGSYDSGGKFNHARRASYQTHRNGNHIVRAGFRQSHTPYISQTRIRV